MGILPMSPTGILPVETLVQHGRDPPLANATHGQVLGIPNAYARATLRIGDLVLGLPSGWLAALHGGRCLDVGVRGHEREP